MRLRLAEFLWSPSKNRLVFILSVFLGTGGLAFFLLLVGGPREKSLRQPKTVQLELPKVLKPAEQNSLPNFLGVADFPHPQWVDSCQRLLQSIGGRVTVGLLTPEGTSFFFPSRELALKPQPSASVIKLQIGACCLQEIEAGKSFLAQRISGLPLEELCQLSITSSDNQAANTLIRQLGFEKINNFSTKWGYRGTFLSRYFDDLQGQGRNLTSAVDCVKFLQDLWSRRLLGEQLTAKFLGWLARQERRSKIPRFLTGWQIYNKTGETWNLPVQNDVAILSQGSQTVFLAILTADSPQRDEIVRRAIAETARDLITTF